MYIPPIPVILLSALPISPVSVAQVRVSSGNLPTDTHSSSLELLSASEPFRLDFGVVEDVPASAPFEQVEGGWRVDATAWI